MMVVTIIGLLSILAFFAATTMIDKAQEVVCSNRIKNLKTTYFQQFVLRGSRASQSEADADLEVAAEHIDSTVEGSKIYGLCPAGGTVTICFDDTTFEIESVTCSIHGGGGTTYLSELADFYALVQEVLDSTIGYVSGTQLISDVYAALDGVLPAVDADLLEDAFGDAELYDNTDDLTWKPSYLKTVDGELTFILYAAVDSSSSSDGWKGYLVYWDGNVYKSTNTAWNGDVDPGVVAYPGTDITDMEEFLTSRGFEQF
jgi:hypothetical protein